MISPDSLPAVPDRRTARTPRGPSISAMPVLSTNAWLRFDAIRGSVRRARPRTVLEIGAGEGGLGAWLARHYSYTGIEPDAGSRLTADARLAAVGRGRVVETLPAGDTEHFDLVCAFEVLEHIVDDAGALRTWHDYVAPGGWLLLSVPAHADQFGPHDELAGHIRRYERDELTGRLQAAGFEVVQLRSCGAGLGTLLQFVRDTLARRSAKAAVRDGSLEERTSASGRYIQPHARLAAFACAAAALPGRLAQLPFAQSNVGTGFVVLARRSS